MKTWMTALSLSIFTLTAAHADIQSLKQNLEKNFPEMKVESVHTTPVKDIYEVYTTDRIVYTNDQARYFFVGNLIDLPEQKNLTEQRQQFLSRIDIKQLPLDQAIKTVRGKGQRVLYLFSDPDCPYCHKLEEELAKIDNVTIYLFMFPLTKLHTNAEKISRQVWCSKNQYQAWTDYTLKQKNPTATDSCSNPVTKNIELAEKLKITGTPTLFLKDGSRLSGGKAAAEIEMLMDKIP